MEEGVAPMMAAVQVPARLAARKERTSSWDATVLRQGAAAGWMDKGTGVDNKRFVGLEQGLVSEDQVKMQVNMAILLASTQRGELRGKRSALVSGGELHFSSVDRQLAPIEVSHDSGLFSKVQW